MRPDLHKSIHIYLSHRRFAEPFTAFHFDNHGKTMGWKHGDRSISYTLALQLPKSGGGLNMKELTRYDVFGLSPAQFKQKLESKPTLHFPYLRGGLVIHSGLHYQSMATSLEWDRDDARITLQGQGVYSRGRWRLFW
jgi:hypothetical protein